MRIAVGGFQHETNTFAPAKATLQDFLTPDAWPGLVRGPELFDAVRGINLPAAGFIDEARSTGHSLVPLTWCSATPSAHVTRDAFEHISALLLDDLRNAGPVDAVYLDLHGAMVAEHVDDADGELLRRVRAVTGTGTPIVCSLDYHANVSPLMVAQASALVAYRTYPHIDMAETGARTLRCLHDMQRRALTADLCQLPFLIPLTSQCTLIEPLDSLMREIAALRPSALLPSVGVLNFTPGFPAADVAKCGPAIFGYGTSTDSLRQSVARAAERVRAREPEFFLDIHSIESALHEVDRGPHKDGCPMILADTQDNPGGGGTSDTTTLLKTLIARRTPRVLAGIVCDPAAAAHAHAVGVGRSVDLSLGARFSAAYETPIQARFEVVALGDGKFTATGPFYLGARMELGPMALLRTGDVHIAVSSRKQQAADREMFQHLGVDPAQFAVLVLKSSVHFRADFGSLASRILVVDAPGANIADPAQLPFRNLRQGMRVAGQPSGKPGNWSARKDPR